MDGEKKKRELCNNVEPLFYYLASFFFLVHEFVSKSLIDDHFNKAYF